MLEFFGKYLMVLHVHRAVMTQIKKKMVQLVNLLKFLLHIYLR